MRLLSRLRYKQQAVVLWVNSIKARQDQLKKREPLRRQVAEELTCAARYSNLPA